MIHVVGTLGTLLVLAAYFLVSSKRVPADSYRYQGLNLVGASALTVYSATLAAWAAVALNAAWGIIAVVAIARTMLRRRSPDPG